MIITILTEKTEYDIMTDSENQIKDTLQILLEKGLLPKKAQECREVYSVRRKRMVSVESTYVESGIYQGDILKIG